MKSFKYISLLLVILVSAGFSAKNTWVIDRHSKLAIYGSTNINEFTCRMEYYAGRDTLRYVKDFVAGEMQFMQNRMSIPVRSFDCGARQISRDFWKTLRSEKYPELHIQLLTLRSASLKNNAYVDGVVDITLAGVTKRFTIRYKVNLKDRNTLLLTGLHTVNFSDFQLAAPQKLNGLIKVKEMLNVEFNLVLTEI